MYSVMTKKRQRQLRKGFVQWLGHVKKEQISERYDNLSELVTNLWFKQRVFLGLRHACLQSKSESSLMKFKAWRNWCETSRKKKYHNKKKELVERIEGIRAERLVKRCFDAIRFGNI
jgi:hypothetical protein